MCWCKHSASVFYS